MSKTQVLADIQAKIKTNGNQEITGDILQGVLTESVNLVPENVSELTNDANYQTATQVDAKVKVVSDEVDNVKAAQTSQATDITNLQEGLSAANNSIQEVEATVSTKADSSALSDKVDKTGYTQNTIGDFIVTSYLPSVELFKIVNYNVTNANQVSASVSVKGLNIYPLNENQVGWDDTCSFRINVESTEDDKLLEVTSAAADYAYLAVNALDYSATQPHVFVRRGIVFCDQNDYSTGSNFMNGRGSYSILNTNGAFRVYFKGLEDPDTGNYETGPFVNYGVIQLHTEVLKTEEDFVAQGQLEVQGDVVAQVYDETSKMSKQYSLSQIGDIQTALQAILGNA